jgi:hypothetical protein
MYDTCVYWARSSYPEAESDTTAQQNLDKVHSASLGISGQVFARLTRMIQCARARLTQIAAGRMLKSVARDLIRASSVGKWESGVPKVGYAARASILPATSTFTFMIFTGRALDTGSHNIFVKEERVR